MSYYGEYPATTQFPVVDTHPGAHGYPQGSYYPPAGSYYPPQPPAYPQYQHRRQSSGLATTSLVLAILAVLTSWLVVGGVIGLVAVVLGVIAFVRATATAGAGRGKALSGIILGFASIIAAMWFTALYSSLISSVSDTGTQLTNCLDRAQEDPLSSKQCFDEWGSRFDSGFGTTRGA